MALNKIKTGSITDDAVNSDKLGAGSVTNTELNKTAITGQTELSETVNDADFTIIYDTSSGSLKKVLRSNLVPASPVISSISPTNASDASVSETFTISGSGYTVGTTARLIDNNGKILEFDTVTRTNTTTITATIATSKLSGDNDPYDVQVTNGEGIATVLLNQVNFNATPVYTTASGSLGTIFDGGRSGLSFSVNATDPESAGNVTFEIQSGSLPAGLSLTNTAAEGGTAIISGNATAVGSDTTSNFILRAVDAASNTTSRAFAITIKSPVSTSFTASGTFSVPTGLTAVDVLVVAGAGGGGNGAPGSGGGGGGGAAGGLIYRPGFTVTPGATVTVTVGSGGERNTSSPDNNAQTAHTGQDSVFGTLTAKGGGGAGQFPGGDGGQGGSGGGGAGGGPSPAGTATQPTQSGDSGAYGFGGDGRDGNSNGAGGGGGGGGASGVVGSCGGFAGGSGANGKAYTIADGTTSVYYAGGGGGGGGQPWNTGGAAGQGGGGSGGTGPNGDGQAGQANKGGGAGGGSWGGGGVIVGAEGGSITGGKGIVIVRY
jgi:hypothetical protein